MNTNKLFSIEKLISKLETTLNTANKIIPIYENSKPYIKNAIKFKNKLQNINIKKYINNYVNNNEDKKNETNFVSFNKPTFFH